MNYMKNYREDSTGCWVRRLTYFVYAKPARLFMNADGNYGATLESGRATADRAGMFHMDAGRGTVLRAQFSIRSEKECFLSLLVSANRSTKIFLGGELIHIFNACSQVLVVRLKRGENIFWLDALGEESTYEVQIRTEMAESGALLSAAAPENRTLTDRGFALYMEKRDFSKLPKIEFLLTRLDQRQFAFGTKIRMEMRDVDTGRRVFSKRVRFARVYRLDKTRFSYCPDCLNGLDLIFCGKGKDGRTVKISRRIYVYEYQKHIEELVEFARRLASSPLCLPYDREAVLGLCSRIDAPGGIPYMRLHFSQILNDFLKEMKDGDLQRLYLPGTKRVFFRDPLDDSVNFYRVTLPRGYRAEREYPLLIICSTKEYGSYGQQFEDSELENLIVADISGRGVTMGSYIGEAAILSALRDLRQKFRVDENRIYIGGYSNGASAALAVAEAYPHLFAGVYALSGRAEIKKMRNLSALHTTLISSETDEFYPDVKKLYTEGKKHSETVRLLSVSCHNHLTIQRVWMNTAALSELFMWERELYPQRFSYYTDRNRHLRAYWITLHGIAPGKQRCILQVDAGRSILDIRLSGAAGLTVALPPFVNRDSFTVRLNGKNFNFAHVSEDCLHFRYNSHGFHPIPFPSADVEPSKGNGLLDVYMEPMKIFVPKGASAPVLAAANAFARPQTNGLMSEVAVWYSIAQRPQAGDSVDLSACSMIAVGRDDSPFYRMLEENAPIRMDEGGFWYAGRFYPGRFCVMQLVRSPWNYSKRVLYVAWNDEALLRRNLFTRCMTLPSYLGGRHPYLGGAALIFDGKSYSAVREIGDLPQPVSGDAA